MGEVLYMHVDDNQESMAPAIGELNFDDPQEFLNDSYKYIGGGCNIIEAARFVYNTKTYDILCDGEAKTREHWLPTFPLLDINSEFNDLADLFRVDLDIACNYIISSNFVAGGYIICHNTEDNFAPLSSEEITDFIDNDVMMKAYSVSMFMFNYAKQNLNG